MCRDGYYDPARYVLNCEHVSKLQETCNRAHYGLCAACPPCVQCYVNKTTGETIAVPKRGFWAPGRAQKNGSLIAKMGGVISVFKCIHEGCACSNASHGVQDWVGKHRTSNSKN